MGHSESSPAREIHSITGLPQETRKISNKQFNPTPKRTTKRTINKAQNKQKEENNKDQSEINDIKTKKRYKKK